MLTFTCILNKFLQYRSPFRVVQQDLPDPRCRISDGVRGRESAQSQGMHSLAKVNARQDGQSRGHRELITCQGQRLTKILPYNLVHAMTGVMPL